MKVKNEVIQVLSECEYYNYTLTLPPELERKLYLETNKVIESIGGKWSRKQKIHVMPEGSLDKLIEIIQTGTYTDIKKEYGFFETPEKLADKMINLVGITYGDTILEPSAGKGSILKNIPTEFNEFINCFELNQDNYNSLIRKGYCLMGYDFLLSEKKYDIIIANPPFSNQQDIDHVNHMLDIANKRVVSVMSAGVTFRTNKKTVAFRERIENLGGTIEMLPEDTFKESGTKVRTCLVYVDLENN